MKNIRYCYNCCNPFYIENIDEEYSDFCCVNCGKEYYRRLANIDNKIKYE